MRIILAFSVIMSFLIAPSALWGPSRARIFSGEVNEHTVDCRYVEPCRLLVRPGDKAGGSGSSDALADCADMSPTQQRVLSGTAIGAGGGAIIGAIAGNAGLGAGIGGRRRAGRRLIYDPVERGQASSYRGGYRAETRNFAS